MGGPGDQPAVLPACLPARASSDLNPDIEKMCQGLAVINTELGATAAPGTPMGKRMQTELSLSQAQYGALWSLMKLTIHQHLLVVVLNQPEFNHGSRPPRSFQ